MDNIQKAFKEKGLRGAAGSAWDTTAGAVRNAVNGLRSTPAAPAATPEVNPKLVREGITNAERLQAAAKANPAGSPEFGSQSRAPASGGAPGARVEYAAENAQRAERMSSARNARLNATRPPPVSPAAPSAAGLAQPPSKWASRAAGAAKFGGMVAGVDQLAQGAKGIMQPGDSTWGDKLRVGVGAASFTPGLAQAARPVAAGMSLAGMVPDSWYEKGLNALGLMPKSGLSEMTPATQAYMERSEQAPSQPAAAPAAVPGKAPSMASEARLGDALTSDYLPGLRAPVRTDVGQQPPGPDAPEYYDGRAEFTRRAVAERQAERQVAEKELLGLRRGMSVGEFDTAWNALDKIYPQNVDQNSVNQFNSDLARAGYEGSPEQKQALGLGAQAGSRNNPNDQSTWEPVQMLNKDPSTGGYVFNESRYDPNRPDRGWADQTALDRSDTRNSANSKRVGDPTLTNAEASYLSPNSVKFGTTAMSEDGAMERTKLQESSANYREGLRDRRSASELTAAQQQAASQRELDNEREYLRTQFGEPTIDGKPNPDYARGVRDYETLKAALKVRGLDNVGAEEARKIQQYATEDEPGGLRKFLGRIGVTNEIPSEANIARKMPARESKFETDVYGEYYTDTNGVRHYLADGGLFGDAPDATKRRVLERFMNPPEEAK